jgi:hypothetical protein
MVGPQFEIQGYFLVIVSILLGILNAEFALLLFISVISVGHDQFNHIFVDY